MEKRKSEIISNKLMVDFLIFILAASILLCLMRGFSSSAASITRKVVVGMTVLSLIGCIVSDFYIKRKKLSIRLDIVCGMFFLGSALLIFPGVNTTKVMYILLGLLPIGFVLLVLYYTVFINYIKKINAKKLNTKKK